MKGEKEKAAIQQIMQRRPFYATTSMECERALKQDTPEAYRSALSNIVTSPNRSTEYAQVISTAEQALKDE